MILFGHKIGTPVYVPDTAWLRHGPFAMWLVKASRPRTIVELGSHHGYSYFTFCQAVREAGLPTRCFAVDTWQGDEHAGFYDNDVFKAVEEHNRRYSDFSTLLRKTFAEALGDIEDGSVDLLHVDGRHYYGDVKEDFESWSAKLSDRAIVLFHDTDVRERGFGVWEYWEELTRQHPGFNFPFQHGLGVLFWGRALGDEMQKFRDSVNSEFGRDTLVSLFGALGEDLANRSVLPDSAPLALVATGRPGPVPVQAPPPAAPADPAAQECARHWLRLGRDRFAASQTAEAHAAFSMALNCAPGLSETHALLANTWLLFGAPHLATHHAQVALAGVPDNADALLALAGAARLIDRPDLADRATRALSTAPGLALLHDLLRISDAIDAEDYEVALYHLAEIHEADPDNVQCRELFLKGFHKFMDAGERYLEFIDGLGLLFPPEQDAADVMRAGPDAASIDIVIPVHNALDDLSACLASVERWWSRAIGQIILVDDASDGETADWLDRYAAAHPCVRLIRQTTNGGFTASVVAGLAESGAAFALLLNSDTIVTPGWIDRLWHALTRRPTTALAGPLSNNAYMQTVTLDPTIPQVRSLPQSVREPDPDTAAAVTLLNSRGVCPRVPLLSGFCLMLRREAYDLAGGLDVATFPQGYWEMQDLCLRLIDLGYDAVLADDSYVHHKGSQSIGTDRRADLLRQGRHRMNERHSALRLLAAEAISLCDPEIFHHRRGWFDFGYGRLAMRGGSAAPEARVLSGTRRPLHVARELRFDPAGQEVCLFVTYAPLGQISDYTRHYMDALRAEGVRVIACHIVHSLDIVQATTLLDAADATVLRLDGGYDFAAWADVLTVHPQLWQADRLYFLNDSIIGPFGGLGPVLDGIRSRNAGFFALSECTNTGYHAQSFFFGWNRTNLQSAALRAFWDGVVVERDKTRVVLEYEYRIAPLSSDLPDASQQIVFGMETALGARPGLISCINPTHHAWRRLLEIGFPFVKTDLLRDGVFNIDTDGWEAVCADHGADLGAMHRHIERSRVQRLHFGPHLRWETL